MGRQVVRMLNGDTLTLGYDKPFNTWFAILRRTGSRHEADVVIGYHPAEVEIAKAENPDIVVGPYPVADPIVLCRQLIPELMGIEPEPEDQQSPCFACRQPPWESNPDCGAHPYNRLHD